MDIKGLKEKYGPVVDQLLERMAKVQPKDEAKWLLKAFDGLAEYNPHIQLDEVKQLISGPKKSNTRAYETNNNE